MAIARRRIRRMLEWGVRRKDGDKNPKAEGNPLGLGAV